MVLGALALFCCCSAANANDEALQTLTELGVDITQFPQLTNLPTMYLTVVDTDGNQVEITSKTETYYSATIVLVDTTGSIKQRNETVGVRLRGNSTSASSIGKLPYRLKFPSKTGLLKNPDGTNDFADLKSWTLLANAFDKTMVRNALTYELGQLFGFPFCPCYRFVDLVYNGDYRGTYQISDHVQQGKKRVNVKSKSGWLIELTRQSFVDTTNDTYFTLKNGGAYGIVKNPDVDDVGEETMNQYVTNMTNYFTAIDDSIYANNYQLSNMSSSTGYRSKMDMESLLDYYLAVEITGNYDSWLSNYCYRDTTEQLKFGPMWDYDLAYGNYPNTTNMLTFNNTSNSGGLYSLGWMPAIYKDPIFILDLYDRWKGLYDNGLVAYLQGKVDSIAAVIKESRVKNFDLATTKEAKSQTGWSINKNALSWLSCPTFSTYEEYVDTLKNYIKWHAAYIDGQFTSEYNLWMDNKYTITLDATSAAFEKLATTDAANVKGAWTKKNCLADVTVNNREFSSSYWNTICLPFDAKESQIKEALGSDFQLREFVGMADDGTTMLFASPKNNKIIAGIPYLIKLSGSSSKAKNPTFINVAITQTTPCSVTYGGYTFSGTLYQKTLKTDGTDLFLDTAGDLCRPESEAKSTMYGMRAYFTVPAASTTAKISGLDDDTVTEINAVSADEDFLGQEGIYNLNGQRVSGGQLKKGIYIVNGKKRIIR